MAAPVDREMLNFSQNLKKTALGIKFTKTLFTQPESLSPKAILNVLQSLGLKIPEEVGVAADVAQIIVAGQAVSSASTASEIESATNQSAAAVKTLNSIALKKGWVDQDTASIISYGADVSMIVASGGTNVQAWVSLALDVANTVASKQGIADRNAIIDAKNQYSGKISSQSKILAASFKDLQEGNIGIYGLIAKMAVETPDLWPQVVKQDSPFAKMFPDLMMVPVVNATLYGHGSSEIWGSWPWPASGHYVIASWSSSFPITYNTLATDFTKETAAQYFFNILLKPWLYVYSVANDEIVGRGNMSMENVAALSYLINPNGMLSATDDYVSFLIGSKLTPYDFDDPILADIASQFVEENYKDIRHTYVESAISIGQSPSNQGFNAYQSDSDIMRAKLQAVQQTDDIKDLIQYPFIYQKLQGYMDFQTTSFEQDPTLGGMLNVKFPEQQVTAWRQLHNYISVLQMLDTFRTDPYLKNTQFAEQLMPFMPSIDSFSQKIQRLQYLSTMRSVNAQAYAQIAALLGVKPSQLVRLTKDDYVGAAKFTVK